MLTMRFVVILIICVTASYAICYTGVQRFAINNINGDSDALLYLASYRGERVNDHFNILVPAIARSLPNPPGWLFDPGRSISELWIAKVKFGALNFIFLLLAGVFLFYSLREIGFGYFESIIGVLLFYTARPVIQNGGIPRVDAAEYFFLSICFFAILRQNIIMLFIVFFIGIFAKETVIIIIPIVMLSSLKRKSLALILLIATVGFYSYFRFYRYPVPGESHFNLVFAENFVEQARQLLYPSKLLDMFSSFGLLWIPAFYALALDTTPSLLKRSVYIIAIILMSVIMLNGNIGRHMFIAFPMVIPLALKGLFSINPEV